MTSFKKQLNEAQDVQNRVDDKLSNALNNLRAIQEEKVSMESKLGQKQAALNAQVNMNDIHYSNNYIFLCFLSNTLSRLISKARLAFGLEFHKRIIKTMLLK